MSGFDVAICFDQNNLNRMVGALYARPSLKARLFSGQRDTAVEGVQTTVGWEMRTAPVFALVAPSPEHWKHAITANGTVAAPHDDACIVSVSDFHLSVAAAGSAPTQSSLRLDVICTVVVTGETATFVPAGVVADLAQMSSFDRAVYTSVLIPQVLSQAGGFLGHQPVPRIAFEGVSFGPPTLLVERGRAVVAAYLTGRPGSPDRPSLRATPLGDFHVLLSREALQSIVNNGVQPLRGHTESVGGRANLGIGQAHYAASIRFDTLSADVVSPTILRAHAGVTLSASAGVDVLSAVFHEIGDVAKGAGRTVERAGETVGDAAGTAVHAVGGAVGTAVHAVGDAASTAVNTVGKVFKSY